MVFRGCEHRYAGDDYRRSWFMKLIVIGGGPAGMAAAVSAKEQGIEDVRLL